MKWEETVASQCRYGGIAERLFGQAEIIWECSENDYQGHANILAHMPDGQFAHYEWTYGSCSGCDDWENRCLTHDQIEAEMREHTAWLPDAQAMLRYVHLEGEYKEAKVPTANPRTSGSVPGMVRWLFGGIVDEFKAMGKAFIDWLALQTPPAGRQEEVSS